MPPRVLFADAFYWVALLNPGDAFHASVTSQSRTLGSPIGDNGRGLDGGLGDGTGGMVQGYRGVQGILLISSVVWITWEISRRFLCFG